MTEDLKAENPANVGFTTREHASKPDAQFATMDPEVFVERYVQTGYEGEDPHGVTRLENLWVLVTRVEDSETVHGLIENDPVLKGVPVYGTAVDVKLTAINKVMPEFKDGT